MSQEKKGLPHTGWLKNFRAIVDAGKATKKGLAFSDLQADQSYVITIPTETKTYDNTISKGIGNKVWDEKDKDGNYIFNRKNRDSVYLPFRNFFNGHGDCIIASASGKTLKDSNIRAKLMSAKATVCMSEDKFDKLLGNNGTIRVHTDIVKLKNATYPGNSKGAKADSKRLTLCMARIELFVDAIRVRKEYESALAGYNKPKAKSKKVEVKAVKLEKVAA
tara:strand:- start:89 stop:748 length:660 start_codon:yes stop_codon:yes gene_type:complete